MEEKENNNKPPVLGEEGFRRYVVFHPSQPFDPVVFIIEAATPKELFDKFWYDME